MKLKFKKSIILILVFFMVFSYINPLFMSKVYASSKTKEEIGEYIAQFAENFANSEEAKETIYSWNNNQRAKAYSGSKTSGRTDPYNTEFKNKYAMDCVGWVSFAIHHSTGLNVAVAKDGTGGFVSPQSHTTYSEGYFETLTTRAWKKGDILISSNNPTHVMIYIGDNKIVDCINPSTGNAVAIRSASSYTIDCIARITEKGVKAINNANLTTIFNGYGTISNSVDFDKYYGIATGEYVGSAPLFRFPSLGDILDWLIGVATYGIKMQFIGWSNILENLITKAMNGAANTQNTVTSSGQQTVADQIGYQQPNKLTIESLVFNKVQLLDINVFDLNNAAGAPLDIGGVIYIIREIIAYWYFTIRQISIIGLLVCLVYIGIRMAISQIAEEKSKYKQMLVNWVVSFIIVFFIHYFMIAAIGLNNTFIGFFEEAANIDEVSLYDTIRTKSYEIKFSTGFGSTIMYMVLIFLLIKYLWIYIKRWLLISILVILAPVLGITYSIEKIKNNKSKILTNWMNDFVQAVFVQTFHALIYTTFVYTAIKLALSSLPGMIVALVFLNFMADADKLIKGIFKIEGKSSGFMGRKESIKSMVENSFVASVAINSIKRPFKVVGKTTGWIANTALGRSQFAKDVKKELGTTNELKDRKTEAFVQGIKGNLNKAKATAGIVTTAATGAVAAMAAIPTLVMEPKAGIALAMLAQNRLGKFKHKEQKIYGYKKLKKLKKLKKPKKSKKQKKFSRALTTGAKVVGVGLAVGLTAAAPAIVPIGVLATNAIRTGIYLPTKKVYTKAKEISDKNIKEKTKLKRERELLKEAEGIELELERDLLGRNEKTDIKIAEIVREINNEKLEQNIIDQLGVNTEEVSDAVNKYKRDNNIDKLNENDIKNIIDTLSNNLEENETKEKKKIVKFDIEKLKANIDAVILEMSNDDIGKIDPNNMTAEEITKILSKAIGRTGSIQKEDVPDVNKRIIENIQRLQSINKELKKNGSEEIDCKKLVENIKNRVGENEK